MIVLLYFKFALCIVAYLIFLDFHSGPRVVSGLIVIPCQRSGHPIQQRHSYMYIYFIYIYSYFFLLGLRARTFYELVPWQCWVSFIHIITDHVLLLWWRLLMTTFKDRKTQKHIYYPIDPYSIRPPQTRRRLLATSPAPEQPGISWANKDQPHWPQYGTCYLAQFRMPYSEYFQ